MNVIGVLIVTAILAYASAGGPNIENHPICVEINGAFHHEFADPDDCICFYECNWLDAINHCCPKDNLIPNWNGHLVYNPTTQVCDRYPNSIAQGAICKHKLKKVQV